jgi:hypothetical protein
VVLIAQDPRRSDLNPCLKAGQSGLARALPEYYENEGMGFGVVAQFEEHAAAKEGA